MARKSFEKSVGKKKTPSRDTDEKGKASRHPAFGGKPFNGRKPPRRK